MSGSERSAGGAGASSRDGKDSGLVGFSEIVKIARSDSSRQTTAQPLLEDGFKVFEDFLGENVGFGEIVGAFEAFVFEPEDVEAGFVAAAFFVA